MSFFHFAHMTQEKRRFRWLPTILSVMVLIALSGHQFLDTAAGLSPMAQYMDLLGGYSTQDLEEDFLPYTDSSLYRITNLTSNISAEADLTPPESARLMAYVSSIYHDGLLQGATIREAQELASQITEYCLPELQQYIQDLYIDEFQTRSTPLTFETNSLLRLYTFRADKDNFKNETGFDIPTSPGSWLQTTSTPPLSPQAGDWSHWLVPEDVEFDVNPPAAAGSQEYESQQQGVIEAATTRTLEQEQAANYWGGYSEEGIYPVELWLDIMYEELNNELTELELARNQKLLTQAVADSFIEAWKVKYTYWTERPDMAIEGFKPQFDNPNFPSYVSGHATVSQTAADILSSIEPDKRELFQAKAQEAADSRLWAGVHFDMDNKEGQKLGKQVAEVILQAHKK